MTIATSTLDALLHPLSAAEFLRHHWPERAVALDAAPPRLGLFPSLAQVPIEQVVGGHTAPIHAVSSRDVDGEQEPISDGRGALTAFRAGRSLCLAGVHTTFPEVLTVLEELTSAVGIRLGEAQCNAYASPASEGVPWHFDDREVFVVHLQGRKRWTLAPNVDVRFPTSNFVLATGGPDAADEMALYAPRMFVGPPDGATTEVELGPGSALFIPRGTWHMTSASEPSLSLTFGLFTPTALDVLIDAVRRECVADERFRRPIALATEEQREASQARLSSLFADWRRSVGAG
jgi:50S ribosomal protein L16 3-hydroxylase